MISLIFLKTWTSFSFLNKKNISFRPFPWNQGLHLLKYQVPTTIKNCEKKGLGVYFEKETHSKHSTEANKIAL